MPQIVVFDTNMLTVPAQFGVDIFEETKRELERSVEFVVLSTVIEELERKLETESRTERMNFRIGLDLTKRCTIEEVDDTTKEIPVDDQILQFAGSMNAVIATNDKKLIRLAVSQGIPVLFLRGKKRLALRGTIS